MMQAQSSPAGRASERQAHLSTCLDKLMTDVQRNLESKNRDKFTQERPCPLAAPLPTDDAWVLTVPSGMRLL